MGGEENDETVGEEQDDQNYVRMGAFKNINKITGNVLWCS